MRKIIVLFLILIFTVSVFAITAQAQTNLNQYKADYAIICRNNYYQEKLCTQDLETCRNENADCRIVYEQPKDYSETKESGITAAVTIVGNVEDYENICCITDIKAYDTTRKRCAELSGKVLPRQQCLNLICCNNKGRFSKINIMKCMSEGGKETTNEKCDILNDLTQQSTREIVCCRTRTQTFYTTKAICRNLGSTIMLPLETCGKETCCGIGKSYEKMNYIDCMNKAGREVSINLCGLKPAEELPLSIFSKQTQETVCCVNSGQAFYTTKDICTEKKGKSLQKNKCQETICCNIQGKTKKMNFMECISKNGLEKEQSNCELIIQTPGTLSSTFK